MKGFDYSDETYESDYTALGDAWGDFKSGVKGFFSWVGTAIKPAVQQTVYERLTGRSATEPAPVYQQITTAERPAIPKWVYYGGAAVAAVVILGILKKKQVI